MKNKNIIGISITTVSLILLIAIIQSCKKTEDNFKNQNLKSNILNRKIDECSDGIDVVCDGILYFNDLAHYEAAIDCIDESYETWNDNFEANNTYVDDDTWNNLISASNFDENQPYNDFIYYFNFNSYYEHIDKLEVDWIDNYNCDSIHDPDLEDIVQDDAEACLLNNKLEVMIGDTIYKFYSDGSVIAIYGMNCDALNSIRLDSSNIHDYPQVVRRSYPISPTCRRKHSMNKTVYYGSSSEFKMKCNHSINFLFRTKEKAKSKNFAKNGQGKWKKRATSLTIRIEGIEYGDGCETSNLQIDKQKQKTRKRLKLKNIGGSNKWFIAQGVNISTHLAEKSTFVYGLDSLVLSW